MSNRILLTIATAIAVIIVGAAALAIVNGSAKTKVTVTAPHAVPTPRPLTAWEKAYNKSLQRELYPSCHGTPIQTTGNIEWVCTKRYLYVFYTDYRVHTRVEKIRVGR